MVSARRYFGFFGDLFSGGNIPTGIGSTAYVAGTPGTGDWTLANNDTDKLWPLVHPQNTFGIGVLAYIWNLIGPGSVSNPSQSLDQYRAPFLFLQNGHTDPWNGGKYPSEYAGIEQEFLLWQHGYPSDNRVDNALVRDPTFTLKKGTVNSAMIPPDEFRGTISSIAGVSGSTVEVTLSATHGQTAGSTFTCWLYGIYPSGSTTPDPQLTGKHTATAHASDPLKFTVTLGAAWTGVGGVAGSGVCIVPKFKITSLTNPSGNTVRMAFSAALEGSVGMYAAFAGWSLSQLWVDGVTGTTSTIDGLWTATQNSLTYHKTATASTSISFTSGTKTIALTAGSWGRTPVVGERITISGSASNNKTVTVASATSSTIVTSETLTTEAAGSAVTLTNLNVVEFNFGSVPNIAGWTSGTGHAFRVDPMHPAFSGSFNGWGLIDRIEHYSGNLNNIGRIILDAFPGGLFTGDTIGNDYSCVTLCVGYNDAYNASSGSALQAALFSVWAQCLVEFVDGVRSALEGVLSGGVAADDIPCVLIRCQPDTDATGFPASWSTVSLAAITFGEQIAQTRLAKCALLDWSDLPKRSESGVWPTASTSIEVGKRAYELQQKLSAGVDTTPTGGAIPVYVLIGDSNMQGAVNNSVTFPQASAGGDPDYDGSWYDSGYATVNRDRLCFIWNPSTLEAEEYAPGKNANIFPASLVSRWPDAVAGLTLGNGFGTVGPEASWILHARKRHPEGVLLLKLGLSGSTTTGWSTDRASWDPAGGDLYDSLLEQWELVQDWCRENRRYPDMRGVGVMLGTNDALDDDATLAFEAKMRALIAALREDLTTTSSSRDPLPITLIVPPRSERMSTTLYSNIPTIAEAIAGIAGDTENVVAQSVQGAPTQEDGVHYTWHGLQMVGEAIDDGFASTSIGTDGPVIDAGAMLNPDNTHTLSGGLGLPIPGVAAASSGAYTPPEPTGVTP